MKMPIEWHESGLANARIHVHEAEQSLVRAQRTLERQKDRLAFFESQLGEAKRRRLDGYDSEKFMVKKTKTKE